MPARKVAHSGTLPWAGVLAVMVTLVLLLGGCPQPDGGGGTSAYTVTFEANGGTPTPEDQNVVSGGKATEPGAMTKGSFVFGGWYKEAGLTSQWDFGTDRGVSHPGADFTLKEECMSDFIPAKDAEFETFFKHYCQYVNAKCSPPDAPQWGHIPADPIDSRHGFFHPILPLPPQIAYQFPQFPGMPVFDKCEGNAGKLRFGGDGRIQTGVGVDLQEILDG